MHEELNPPKQRVIKQEEPKPRPVVVGDADGPIPGKCRHLVTLHEEFNIFNNSLLRYNCAS